MLLAWLCSFALAGSQLVLTSDRPVVAYVNMAPHPLKGGSHKVTLDLADGKGGVQKVAIRNVLQELIWTGEVDVPEHHRVTLSYVNRRVAMSQPESIKRRKLSDRGLYNVDGGWVKDRPGRDPRDVTSPKEAPKPTGPKEDVFLGAVEEAGSTAGAGGQQEAEEEALSRPAPGLGDGVLRLANRTTSWANLVLDKEDVPFRGERSKELTLGSGPHFLEVRDFRQELVWHGTVWVWPGETVELQFSESAEPAAPERPEAWLPSPLPEPVVP